MFCPKCGTNNPENAVFCAGCGAPFSPKQSPQQMLNQMVPPAVKPRGTRSSGLPLIIGIAVAAVAVIAIAVFAISRIFFSAHPFRGEVGYSYANALMSASITDDTISMLLSSRDETGTFAVEADIESVVMGDETTVYTFKNVTWDDVEATGSVLDSLYYQISSYPDLKLSGRITVPNSASEGKLDGTWGIEIELDNLNNYTYEGSMGFGVWARVDEEDGSVQIYVPTISPEIELRGSDGEYELSYDGTYCGEINVMPE